ncbi:MULTISPECIES: hypothetical protein [unclassified Mesorhizobium]|uniref:hypothetical protein n=1 Tax=unclassified Mesorhizobium TaxID=325217 RepID=UPI001671E9CF|nr:MULTISPECIES: hypothetical protein [unclassified Mesorhizobium]
MAWRSNAVGIFRNSNRDTTQHAVWRIPPELDVLIKVLNDYCARQHVADEDERERIAVKVMALFGRGVSDPVLLSAELERGSV